jgi:hypothetical protein
LDHGEAADEVASFFFKETRGNIDVRSAEDVVGISGVGWVGVADGVDDTSKSGFDEDVGAGSGSAVATARF